jgi:hypothetical protein
MKIRNGFSRNVKAFTGGRSPEEMQRIRDREHDDNVMLRASIKSQTNRKRGPISLPKLSIQDKEEGNG